MVIGDVMIDRYLDGKVDRISPEAPVPVLALGKEDNRLGGAANVALNLKALGATVLLAGIVGEDPNGPLLRQLLRDADLSADLIMADPSRPTTVKTRLTANGQQLMRVDREVTTDLVGAPQEGLLTKIHRTIDAGNVDLVLFQDYNKGVLYSEFTQRLLELCRQRDIPTVVDPKNKGFWSFQQCTLFKPNLREIQQQVEMVVKPTLNSLDLVADIIFEKLSCKSVMITLSEHGIYVNDGKKSSLHATDARDVADVSGAGDTVISIAACGLAAGMALPDIAKLANRAGAQVIAKRGVVAVDLAALREA
ncbi:hypothetical protein A3850_014705 [Lewinella sp. 4G2]|nr:hypothetical protein A3850_014705 [Lewinella sp. 4G2]